MRSAPQREDTERASDGVPRLRSEQDTGAASAGAASAGTARVRTGEDGRDSSQASDGRDSSQAIHSAPQRERRQRASAVLRKLGGRRLGLVPLVPEEGAAIERAPSRPPARMLRFVKAYWVTFVVIASYLSVRVQARFRSRVAIERILAKKHIRNARRIERAIVQLQGLFIKVGQLISIMTNFLPAEFREQLEGLQDQVPPRPYPDIERRIREEFDGKSPDELFASFDRAPVASASIGQVHLARLHGGDKVAVKVQYPDIESIVRSDLTTLRRIFSIVGYFVRYDGLDEVYREIRAMIVAELDFRAEAENASRIAANFARRREVAFPRPIPGLCTARVLTTRFEEGCKVSDLGGLKRAGIDRKRLAQQVVELYCQQIFTDGMYHADPHPGNLLVRQHPDSPSGVCVVFLDFGAVAEISPEMRLGIAELIQGGLAGDTGRIVRAMKQMGFVARGADDRVFDRVVEYFHSRFQEEISLDSFNLKDIKFDPQKSFENLADLRRMDISMRELTSSFHVPKEWILLERTLLLLVGLCTVLDPDMNPMTVIRPYLERFVLGDEGDWSTLVVDTAKDLLLSTVALPGDMRRFMRAMHSGDVTLRVKNLEASSRLMYRLGHQFILVAIGIAGAVIALILEGRGEIARAEWAWWTARGAGAMLVWSWWSARGLLRRDR
jgi:predicted unusual protein kinase regulating ubiquinone biosynthesis (AarF/ABC1/UbiB family)